MKILGNLWRKLTHTKALELSSGRFETLYFESVYRVTYLTGISFFQENPLYSIYSITVKLLLILFYASELWHFLATQWTIDTIIESVSITFIQLCTFYKYTKKLANESVYRRLTSSMNSPNFDVCTDDRMKIFDMWRQRNEGLVKLVLGLGTGTIIAWYVYPLVDNLDYNLSVSIRLPYSYQSPILYTISYIMVTIVFSYMSYFVMVNDLIIQAQLMHLLCQYAILSDCFKHILRDCRQEFKGIEEDQLYSNLNFREKYKDRLGRLIQQHKFILNNTTDLRDILSAPMLAQLAVSTTLICSIGYRLVSTSVNVNITKWLMILLYLGYNMFGLFILCRWCEEVKIQSTAVGEAVYFSGWERGVMQVPGVRSSILLILTRCNKPLVLSAGGVYELSLEAFATMIKTSYSALTVLLRFR